MLSGLGCKSEPSNRAFSLGWCITAHSESDFLPPVLFLGLICLIHCPCILLTFKSRPICSCNCLPDLKSN